MAESPTYLDTSLSFEERVDDLIGQMTLEEKASQMKHDAPAIERLGVPAYNWWNECLHGVARAGIATVYPQAIGMGATWNADLLFAVATAISDEGRAKYHEAVRHENRGIFFGLTFWTPNINIFRDPRWGRGQETYGEDPYLMARLGVAFVKGLQGDDPKYLKSVATPKHYAVHSGPEHDRHHFDINVSQRDLYETYLPAFKATVMEGEAYSVMGAYQRFRGDPCCASPLLLDDILRQEWGFDGYVVSDCGAIKDIFAHHQVVATGAEAAAMAVKAGCDLNCGEVYPMLLEAVEQGLIDEATVDQSVKRLFLARFKMGMFDPAEQVPFADTPYSVNDSAPNKALALKTAHESMVLLKNADSFLPLDRKALKSIAVIGPNADSVNVLLSNYYGIPSQPITPLAGIRAAVGPDTAVYYAQGSTITGEIRGPGITSAVDVAQMADVAVLVLGISQQLEGEEGQQEGNAPGIESQGDRGDIVLPEVQQRLLEAVHATGTPVVLVLMNGGAVTVNWADENVPAIIEAWYPGQAGGTALADVLFGDYNPGGRLPVTVYKSVDDLPDFRDYDMRTDQGRTYRFFTGEPLYPFGYGLSYTSFAYSDLQVSPESVAAGDSVTVSVTVTNTGDRAGDEVVQVYLKAQEASVPAPLRQLVGFKRLHLAPGASERVSFTFGANEMALYDDLGQSFVDAGVYEVAVGGGQPDNKIAATTQIVRGKFTVAVGKYDL